MDKLLLDQTCESLDFEDYFVYVGIFLCLMYFSQQYKVRLLKPGRKSMYSM